MNMKEIAQLAGVTAATVSNAINGTGNVSEKKRKEIMEIIEREGYSPNRFAKSLRTKESNTIGIMVEDITAFQTPRIINGINNYVEKQGYAVILNNMSLLEKTGNHYSELSSYQSAISKSIKLFNKTQIDGLVYVAMHDRDVMELIPKLSIPIVLVYCYDTSKKNGKESIFEIQYQMGDQGQQSDWLYYFIPKTTNAEIITGVPDCSTLLTGGWNVPTPEMIASYEPGDLRVDPSIAVAVGTLDAANALVVADVLKVGDPKINDYQVNYPFINKYRHAHSKIENTDDNWPVYRYADCLLLLAECLVEQGRAGDAAPYVNQVRARAGLPAVTTINAEVVANERRHELAFENHRWYDLLRTGKAIEVMTAYGKYIKTIDTELPERTYQIKPEYLLYPIPYNELQLNDQLKQNPGY